VAAVPFWTTAMNMPEKNGSNGIPALRMGPYLFFRRFLLCLEFLLLG
jgi:hypothetical protein